jgi:cobalamin biosynthesis protein CbiM
MQALLFADGGLSALGLNVFNMSIIGVWSGYFIFVFVKKIMPKKKPSIVIAGALAAFISVPMAAAGFVLQYALGGTATFSITTVLGAMVSTHILIGIGEALITGLTVSAVLATRPDLVFGYKGAKQTLEIRTNT